MSSNVFPQVTSFAFLDDPAGNYSRTSYKIQFNPDGSFTAESSDQNSSTDASGPNYNYKREDSGTYAVGNGGSSVTLQFTASMVSTKTCFGTCDCGNCDTAMRPWTAPDATIECDLANGKLTKFPSLNGYSDTLWGRDYPATLTLVQ